MIQNYHGSGTASPHPPEVTDRQSSIVSSTSSAQLFFPTVGHGSFIEPQPLAELAATERVSSAACLEVTPELQTLPQPDPDATSPLAEPVTDVTFCARFASLPFTVRDLSRTVPAVLGALGAEHFVGGVGSEGEGEGEGEVLLFSAPSPR
ncbi:hypothetical protein SCP_0305570 [Sparassis crispa]|uniref:Uncharacterized protein n=1 Tax=Sparassis crispa TaxID=139825 RepID=A0A401GF71_9APHY|nr:hypothetical protein SCP_0305570 [Sparassis crispa]GBE80837.1 hypothetical protein SCP_0305570 [Sparassis crispa]